MIGSIVRSVVAVVVGLIAGMVVVVANEALGAIFHPVPPGFDATSNEAMKAHVARYPAWALLLGGLGWGLATFVSSWLATRLGTGRHPAHGIALGAILLAAAVANMLMLPYPIWFWVENLVLLPVCFTLGAMLGKPPSSTAQSASA
jgi:hypothetical protein